MLAAKHESDHRPTSSERVTSAVRDAPDFRFIDNLAVRLGLRSPIIGYDELAAVAFAEHSWLRRFQSISAAKLDRIALATCAPGIWDR